VWPPPSRRSKVPDHAGLIDRQLLSSSHFGATPPSGRLGKETSLHLPRHQDNSVYWRPEDLEVATVMNALFVNVKVSEDLPPAGHPEFGKTLANNTPTAYSYQRQNCSLPTTEPALLPALLGD
jgi:hypothetical protein